MWNRHLWILALVVVAAGPTHALQVYEVDDRLDFSFADCTGAPGDCSLRGAISKANNDGDDSQIILGDETYLLSIVGTDENNNVSGDLDVSEAVEIVAAPGTFPVIEQSTADRVFDFRSGTGSSRIVGPITITGGEVGSLRSGGGIQCASCGLELEDVILTGNRAGADGGCLAHGGSADHPLSLLRVTLQDCHSEASGGGASLNRNGNLVTIVSSVIERNTAYERGGGLYLGGLSGGNVVILDSTIRGNLAGHQSEAEGKGGGIYFAEGNGVLRQSTVSDNQAGVPATTTAEGGGVFIGSGLSFLFENSTVSGNRTAGASQLGAGIRVGSLVTATFDHTSVIDNPTQGMAAIDVGLTSITVKNSIIDDGCSGSTNNVFSSGLNVERPWNGGTTTTCSLTNPSDLKVTDLVMRPLAGYGGPTMTHGLFPVVLRRAW